MGKWIQTGLTAALLVLAFLFWQQRTELQQLKASRPAPVSPVVVTADVVQVAAEMEAIPAGVHETPTPPAPMVELEYTPTGMAPKARTSGLELAAARVTPVEGGLLATLRFTPTTVEPLGIIDIVVRLPVDDPALITRLDPTEATRFSSTAQRVAENGKFAIFHGTLEAGEAVEFVLGVSAPVTADVRGTAGIGPYDLIISESGAKAQPKP